MYKSIVIPLDGSRHSEMILPYARRLAESMGLSVELFHAIDQKSIDAFVDQAHGRYSDGIETDLKKRALQYLDVIASREFSNFTAECLAQKGRPEDAIMSRARGNGETLIAMATRGHAGVKRWFLGSVADKVLQATTNPLLLVKGTEDGKVGAEGEIKNLLVPLDGSELAECILPHAAGIAKAMKLPVELVRAYSLPIGATVHPPYDVGILPVTADNVIEVVKGEAEEYLEGKASQLRALGAEKVACFTALGDAADQIIETAQKTPRTLVVMSTHGRSGIGRWVLGSVADRVIRHSGQPVLVVRPQNS